MRQMRFFSTKERTARQYIVFIRKALKSLKVNPKLKYCSGCYLIWSLILSISIYISSEVVFFSSRLRTPSRNSLKNQMSLGSFFLGRPRLSTGFYSSIASLIFIIFTQCNQRSFGKADTIVKPYKRIILLMSLRRRMLTEVDVQQRSNTQRTYDQAHSFKKLTRVQKMFKHSPSNMEKTSGKKQVLQMRSKFKQSSSYIQQLNNLLDNRRVGGGKAFFADELGLSQREGRSKSKINKDIEHSIHYIENIRKNSLFVTQTSPEEHSKPYHNIQETSLVDMIGLNLPALRHKSRFTTEPARSRFMQQNQTKVTPKTKPGLYSYLERQFVSRRQQALTEHSIVDYAKKPGNKQFHKLLLQKSRRFIKQKAQHCSQIELGHISSVILQESKKIIEEEIKTTKSKYENEYRTRSNIPYFSFLSLGSKEKRAVLESMRRKKNNA